MPTSLSKDQLAEALNTEASKVDIKTCSSADLYLKTLLNMAAATMQRTMFQWKVTLETDTEMEEDVDNSILQQRIMVSPSGRVDFKLELYYAEELMFSLTTRSGQNPQVFMRMMENRSPWDCLLDAANHIE